MFRVEKQDGFARLGVFDGMKTPHLIDLRDDKEVEELKRNVERRAAEILLDVMPETYKLFLREKHVIKLVPVSLNAERLIKTIFLLKKYSEKPLYISSFATPQNASLLIYLGADFLDNAVALKKAYQGIYQSEVGEMKIESLSELPCNCFACLNREEYQREFEFLADHNTNALKREVLMSRTALKTDTLRELVESRVKTNPENTAILRIYDSMSSEVPHAVYKKAKVYPTSEISFYRPEFKYYFNRIVDVYDPASPAALLLPCSAKKPYLLSKTHRAIRGAVGDLVRGVNEVIISSPFVAPRELELVYPISFYDTPTTGQWSEWEIEFVAERLSILLEKFESVVGYLSGGYRKVAEKASKKAGIDIRFAESLQELRKILHHVEKAEFDLYKEIFRHMMRYQFGLEFEVESVKGKYPNLEFFKRERIARVDMRYGNLDIYGELAEFLRKQDAYTVRIDEFDVRGTVFSKGVLKADERIRPNDVVVYYNSMLTGVGKAVIPGKEMGVVDGKAVLSRRKTLN